jgi:hypothetical protein
MGIQYHKLTHNKVTIVMYNNPIIWKKENRGKQIHLVIQIFVIDVLNRHRS